MYTNLMVSNLNLLPQLFFIVSRDIKAGNILLNTEGQAKLADFGVAGQLTVSRISRVQGIFQPGQQQNSPDYLNSGQIC